MRFDLYIKEADFVTTHATNIENARRVIGEKCKPFIKEFGNMRFYRGTDDAPRPPIMYKILKPRTDRRPLSTPKDIHKYMDDYFNKKFGWRPRSNGMFTATVDSVSGYGNTSIFFPIGNYKYIYNPRVHDTIDIITSMENIQTYLNGKKEEDEYGYQMGEYMMKELEKYKSNGLKRYEDTANIEVIWKCDSYLLVTPWTDTEDIEVK